MHLHISSDNHIERFILHLNTSIATTDMDSLLVILKVNSIKKLKFKCSMYREYASKG